MDPSPKKKPKPLYKAKNISGLRKTAYKLEKKDIRTLVFYFDLYLLKKH